MVEQHPSGKRKKHVQDQIKTKAELGLNVYCTRRTTGEQVKPRTGLDMETADRVESESYVSEAFMIP